MDPSARELAMLHSRLGCGGLVHVRLCLRSRGVKCLEVRLIEENLPSKRKSELTPYVFFEVILTEKRPVDASGTDCGVTDVSTLRTAEDEDAYVRFSCFACSCGT